MKDKSTLVTSSQTEAKLAGNAMTAPATYTAKGLLNGLKTDMGSSNILRNYTYNFNSGNGNLKSRTFSNKIQTAVTETFAYDSLYRLTSVTGSNAMTITYGSGADNAKVNIYSKTGLGAYTYHPTKVHAVNSIATNPGYVLQQNVTYTDFNKAKTITYGDYLLDVVYGPDRQRVKSVLKKNNSIIKTVIFAGNYERITKNDTVIHLYYIAGGDGLCGIHVKQTKGSAAISDGMYYVHPDHLGSLAVITDAAGNVKQQSRFDAWGQREFVVKDNSLVFDKGFTGHEHLDEFGLINMNARLYDPILGRFLSPDPYVVDDTYSQDYNRYTYARNNPLIYADETGEWVHLVIGAIIGGTANVIANWKKIDGNFWKGLGYFGVGAAAGALGAGVGAGVSSMLPVSGSVSGGFAVGFWGTTAATTATSSFVAGAAIGGAAGFSSGFTTGFGNSLLGGDNFGKALGQGGLFGLYGGLSGAAAGGLFSGINAMRDGRRFWDGATVNDFRLRDHNIPFVPQNAEYNCGPASAEAVTNGQLNQNGVRSVLGGDPNKKGIADIRVIQEIQKTGRGVVPTAQYGGVDAIYNAMTNQGNVVLSLKGNPGHMVVGNAVWQRTATKISGRVVQRLFLEVMDPARGQYIRQSIGNNQRFFIILF